MVSTIEKARKYPGSMVEVLLGGLLFQTGLAHMLAHRTSEAMPFYEQALPLQREMSKKLRHIQLQWALDHLSIIYIEQGRGQEALPLVEEALQYSRDYGLEFGNYWFIMQNLASLKLEAGLAQEAIQIQTNALEGMEAEAVKHGQRPGARHPDQYLRGLSQLASMQIRHGDRGKGVETLERALRMSLTYELEMSKTGANPIRRVDLPLLSFMVFTDEIPARCARLRGFVDGWLESNELRKSFQSEQKRTLGIEKLSQHLGQARVEEELAAGRKLTPESAVAYALGDKEDPLVSALLEADDIEDSLRTGTAADGMVSTESARILSEAGFSIPSALVRLSLGLNSKDEEDLQAALSTLVEVEDRHLMAICLEALAEIAGEQGSFEESARLGGAALSLRESVGQASMPCMMASVHDALGHDAFEAIVQEGSKLSMREAAEYASRGRGERKRPSSGWSSLTPTEVKVADLVAKGLTNPQIAERLFISKRTVQSHLYNIFTKLNVSTRSELTAQVVERRGS